MAATYALTLVFGFTIGNIYMMQALLVGEIFGMVSYGAIFGIVAMAGQAGSGLGPLLVGFLEDRSGSYDLAFTVTSIVTFSAALLLLLARPIAYPEAGAVGYPVSSGRAGSAAHSDSEAS